MINEANEPSSACRLWRIPQVETSTPPTRAPTLSSRAAQSSRFKVGRFRLATATRRRV